MRLNKDKTRGARRGRQSLRDVTLGLAVFTALTVVLGAPAGTFTPGHAVARAALSVAHEPALEVDTKVFAVLGLTFSLIFAFNLALYRHLRRVYASPRRDGWRRGR